MRRYLIDLLEGGQLRVPPRPVPRVEQAEAHSAPLVEVWVESDGAATVGQEDELRRDLTADVSDMRRVLRNRLLRQQAVGRPGARGNCLMGPWEAPLGRQEDGCRGGGGSWGVQTNCVVVVSGNHSTRPECPLQCGHQQAPRAARPRPTRSRGCSPSRHCDIWVHHKATGLPLAPATSDQAGRQPRGAHHPPQTAHRLCHQHIHVHPPPTGICTLIMMGAVATHIALWRA